MIDLISRQAAIKAICEDGTMFERQGKYTMTMAERKQMDADILDSLPSAQPGWIPCNSGKFPEESGTYTVTAYDGATKRVTYAKYQKRLKRWELTGARAYWRVLAWQPKPQPWEGEQDGEG